MYGLSTTIVLKSHLFRYKQILTNLKILSKVLKKIISNQFVNSNLNFKSNEWQKNITKMRNELINIIIQFFFWYHSFSLFKSDNLNSVTILISLSLSQIYFLFLEQMKFIKKFSLFFFLLEKFFRQVFF